MAKIKELTIPANIIEGLEEASDTDVIKFYYDDKGTPEDLLTAFKGAIRNYALKFYSDNSDKLSKFNSAVEAVTFDKLKNFLNMHNIEGKDTN